MRNLRLVSLFAGCGGTDIGFQGGFAFLSAKYKKLPVKLIYANDNDKNACNIFDSNFPIDICRKDIQEVDSSEIPDHDILTAGFPCQTFSIIAQNPPRLGVRGPNGNLFFEVCRILKDKKPLCFVAENVKGILSANKGKAFPLIMESFRNCGYYVFHILLNAYHFGIPQKRERVFIIGFRDPSYMEMFNIAIPVNEKNVLKSVLIDENKIDSRYYFSERAVNGLKNANKKMNKGRIQDPEYPCNTVGSHLAKVSLNSTDPVLKINGRYRRFTPREVARIQSFPESFKLCGTDGHQFKALGNAIPPVMAWYVAKSLVEAIKKVNKISSSKI